MSFRSNALVAAVAAASWFIVPAALSQEEESTQPNPTSQDTGDALSPAQDTSQTDAAPAATAATAPIDDKKIEQFADAYLAVQTIQQKASAELQTTSDPAEVDKVKASAESAMISAVEQSGLKVDEFNHIVAAMSADANVRAKVAAELQERTSGSPES